MRNLLALAMAGLMTAAAPAADEPAKDKPATIEQVEKQLEKGAQLLDVRTKSEWDKGHLKGATRVDIFKDGFLEKVKAKMDPKKPLVVYCHSGGRSADATEQLREAGFTTVYDLDGGITAWKKAGKPVEK
ncbi:rhodanese-like domain-containing protein [Luteolibacter marinus]|uniref:rhodanese-like domain-containing protein n=1 Tax=Luteolibacter marinus TaxID=2776705 RepID=UPI001866F16C|nr:rhodanese-like domain-containing protein [Luteolibacter marinus]